MDVLCDGKKNVFFQNWSKTYGCKPLRYFEPKTFNDIRGILSQARRVNANVKVIGLGCSPSTLACTDGYMISMKNFDKVLNINKELLTVEVQAGISISKLNKVLQQNNMALPILPTISHITLIGAVSTGTHGSGINFYSLSSYVLQVEIMLADGSVRKFTEKDGDLFNACCLSLGSFGIILSITYKCQIAFNLLQNSYSIHYKDLLDCLDLHISSSDHFRFHWFPHTDMCQLQHISRTALPITKAPLRSSVEYIFGLTFHQCILWLSHYIPSLIPWINKLWFRLFKSSHSTSIDVSYKIFNFNCLYKQSVMEWAIPIEDTARFFKTLVDWTKTSGYPAHSPVEFRFSKGDNILLSPSFGRDACYINIISWRPFGKDLSHEKYWHEVEQMALECGGRPHWAKDHGLTSKDLTKLYPKWQTFLDIRDSLDPKGMFLNNYLKRIFEL